MGWVALKMLTGDRAKFSGIVIGLTFAALLVTQQGSIFCGMMLRTAAQITDISGADLWVMDVNVRYIDDVKPMIQTTCTGCAASRACSGPCRCTRGRVRRRCDSTTGRAARERCDRDGDLARAG